MTDMICTGIVVALEWLPYALIAAALADVAIALALITRLPKGRKRHG